MTSSYSFSSLNRLLINDYWIGALGTVGVILGLSVLYRLLKFDSWRRRNMFILKDVPVTPDKNWKIVGKTNPVTIEQIPLLVKEMRESFFTHK
ncbi:hypothetical protein JH06_4956 [Blastocystis sp. subtype 4]|uniref:hypothetical protein n=1 Tax=Blastocystis sp. subtype 4 TaxID=944170 RepID=UPI0007112893|nr:hypothetical protein JH06_4956 [Blastocystis sp. subtype 4]KNB41599.1 hypothetical protein JH06_4956 [Blastocystis sp. subtype 4]|eukprot:XP_014525042.1 hypothetical protein JH06_4956 [Blastocystis sp. subtype 4]